MARKTLTKKPQLQPPPPPPTQPLTPSQFYHTLTTLAVSQICQSTGFTSTTPSALRTLTSLAAHYLQTLARLAKNHSASLNRTHSNLHDVVSALEDLHSPTGFLGASDVRRPLLQSSLLTELARFVARVDETPFAQPIPKSGPVGVSFGRCGGGLSGKDLVFERGHVPGWLPPFPDIGTCGEEVGKKRREVLFPSEEVCVEVGRSGKREGEGGGELRAERRRVRFRLGVRGGGDGDGVGVVENDRGGGGGLGFKGAEKELTLKEMLMEKKREKRKNVGGGGGGKGLLLNGSERGLNKCGTVTSC